MRWHSPLSASGNLVAGRLLWRLAAFVCAWILTQGIVESLVGPLFAVLSRALGEPVPMYPFTMLAGCVGGTVIGLRFQFAAPWALIGVETDGWQPRRLAVGAALGSAALLVTAALLWGMQRLHFVAVVAPEGGIVADSWGATALRLCVILAPAALWEELAFRGYLQGVAVEASGDQRVARAVTSVAFGAIHLMNPGANLRTTGIVMLAGWCLSLVRERRGLPAAFTAHFAWNWVMAAVLHVPVSGQPFATPGYRATVDGPDWLTGGSWGPEGSIVAAAVLGMAAYLGARGRASPSAPSGASASASSPVPPDFPPNSPPSLARS
jgi:membrane protease YdiL (CAAX protease family)